jgi:hypothetical protein
MSLHFPNPIRRYDTARDCVCFWGSDSALEIAFEVELAALRSIDSSAGSSEASMLRTYDGHLAAIRKAAGAAYSRKRQSYHRLTAADF